MPQTTPAEGEDSAPGFSLPAIRAKKLTAAFDGGRLTSDGGVLLLAQAERAMVICRRLADCMADRRDPSRITHQLDDTLRARVLAIACGYEDADDLDALRDDPGFRLALGKLTGSGAGLASQPTMSRWENAPTTRELAKTMAAMVGIYCASYARAERYQSMPLFTPSCRKDGVNHNMLDAGPLRHLVSLNNFRIGLSVNFFGLRSGAASHA